LVDLGVTPAGACEQVVSLSAGDGADSVNAARTELRRRVAQATAAALDAATGTRRYNLALPEALFHRVTQHAAERDTTVAEVIRRFLKLGLLISEVSEAPDSAVIIRQGGTERQIVIL
jgi:hypothetical protein